MYGRLGDVSTSSKRRCESGKFVFFSSRFSLIFGICLVLKGLIPSNLTIQYTTHQWPLVATFLSRTGDPYGNPIKHCKQFQDVNIVGLKWDWPWMREPFFHKEATYNHGHKQMKYFQNMVQTKMFRTTRKIFFSKYIR
jgi:hypothetical protein